MARFIFHIPYLIRMFTLLLYRWHTSGGFSYFYNFTVIYAITSSVVSVVGYRHYIKIYDSNNTEIKDITITTTSVTFSDANIFSKAKKITLYYPNATDYSFSYETK